MLGDRGVGKTSIVQVKGLQMFWIDEEEICEQSSPKGRKTNNSIQRLVNNSYSGEHTPTMVKEEHYPRYFFPLLIFAHHTL